MKKIRTSIFLAALCAFSCFLFAGCGEEPVVTVNYYVDDAKVEEIPDRNFYDIVTLDCTNTDANATWNQNTWSLTYTPVKKDTEINVYFEYTKHTFKIDGVGYDDLLEAFAAIPMNAPVTIELTKDYEGFISSPMGSDITLNLNGFTLDGVGFDTISCNGKMTINGEGTITNTVFGEYSKSLVNYGALTLNNVTIENNTSNVAIWNSNNGGSTMALNDCKISHIQDCIVIINSGEMNLNNCEVTGVGLETHPTIYSNTEGAILNLNGGSVKNSETGYTIYRELGTVNLKDCAVENTYGLEETEEETQE